MNIKHCSNILHLLCLLLLTLCPQMALAEEPADKDIAHSPAANQADRRVRVGFCLLDGYHNKQGSRKSGYGYDFLQLVRRFSNLNFDYLGSDKTWEENEKMLKNGEIDLLTGVLKTPEHDKVFDYSFPIGSCSVVLYAREGETRFRQEDYSTYSGMVIGVIDGDATEEHLKAFAATNHFTYYTVYYDSYSQLTEAINSHKVDAICASSLLRTHHMRALDSFDNENFYAVVKKGNKELLTQVDDAITNMHRVERDWSLRLNQSNYMLDAKDSRIEFSEQEKKFILAHSNGRKKIIVATQNNWPPYSWVEDGEYHGIIIDFFDQLMKMAGLDYEYYVSDKQILADVVIKNKEVDLYLTSTYDVQESEQKGYVTTHAYAEPNIALLRRKNQPTIRTLAMSKTTPVLNRIASMTNKVELVVYDDTDAAVKAVVDGRADGAYLYNYTAQRYVAADRTGKLMLSIDTDQYVPLRMIANEEDGYELISILTQCISAISQSDRSSIASKYLTPKAAEISYLDFFRQHQVSILACLAAIIIIVLLYQRHQAKLIYKHDRAARKAAEAANEAKTTFLFNMSHDIRTPMNAIIGFTELLRRHQDNPELRENYLDKINKSSTVLLSIINNVLEMARVESGNAKLEEGVMTIGQIGESLYPVIEQMLSAKGISFSTHIEVEHRNIYCDKAKMREILLNFLSNAYKYTHTGGKVSLSITEEPCSRVGYARMITKVADTGIGMKPEYVSHIFDQFSREHNTTENKIEGTGLGMAIVKRYVDLMGGTIDVESEEGKGSTFTVTIEHRIAEMEEVPEKNKEIDPDKKFDGHRLLLAEDNELNAEIAIEILSETGFEVEHAANGQICVEMLQKSQPGYYELILMDIQMPVMNGYEATRQIRKLDDPQLASIPIVAMTANAFEEDKREAREAGMDAHLAKPIDVQALLTTLATFIK